MMNTATKTDPFAPALLKGLALQNRLVMAPMTRSRAIDNLPNDLMATYYAQRATAGLIVTEGVSPSPNGLGYARIPGLFTQEQVDAWKKVTDAVHSQGGKIFAQLMHTGRVSHPANMPVGARILAPSERPVEGQIWTDAQGMQPYSKAQAMSAKDIAETIDEHAQAAKNAMAAGFDGVELHGANGYLLEQFINPGVNNRQDAYGGTLHNRLRFVLETVDAVVAAIGADKVGIRLSPFNKFNDMPAYSDTNETYQTLVEALNGRRLLYIHVVETSARTSEQGQQLLTSMREKFNGLMIVNGGYNPASIEAALDDDRADLVSLGVPFLANPDLVYRLQHKLPLNSPNPDTFYTPDEIGYTDYPHYQQ
ncbi:MAG TPA: alkene reductase [Cyclobacteriaceae bacterium]|nr:alkene reductase [Cyclobacteriaceae bacterium]